MLGLRAGWTVPAAPTAGQEVSFDGTASSAEPGTNLVSAHWEFGDGTAADQSESDAGFLRPTHAYAAGGTYTIKLTRGDQVTETKMTIGLDRRAPYKAADRKAQFGAVMRAHALFNDMSALTDGNNAYVVALNAATNTGPDGPAPPPGYYATTTANAYTFQFNWGSSNLYVVNMSPVTAAAVVVTLQSL